MKENFKVEDNAINWNYLADKYKLLKHYLFYTDCAMQKTVRYRVLSTVECFTLEILNIDSSNKYDVFFSKKNPLSEKS